MGDLVPASGQTGLIEKVDGLDVIDKGGEKPSFEIIQEFTGKTIVAISVATGENGYGGFDPSSVEDTWVFGGGEVPTLPESTTFGFLGFAFTDGTAAVFYYSRDCCAQVSLEDIEGDFEDLIGSPLIVHETVSGKIPESERDGSETWTFYRFATERGMVVLRWVGCSNGYYSEEVSMEMGTYNNLFSLKRLNVDQESGE